MAPLNPDPIIEPQRSTPVLYDADVLVLGGSCTGVFAAVRAAHLGCRVALVEQAGALGGVATRSLVNVWHSPLDEIFERPIIGGLTTRVMERLGRRGAVVERPRSLVPQGPYPNVIVAGRMLDADPLAHAAVRVMVNLNQTGEAAGVAAGQALQQNTGIDQVAARDVRRLLAQGGSIIL